MVALDECLVCVYHIIGIDQYEVKKDENFYISRSSRPFYFKNHFEAMSCAFYTLATVIV